jgi:hypothetical protein
MIEPVISIYLADEESVQIPDNFIKSFKLYASIFSSFPGAEIVLDDPEGKFLGSLAIKPGNLVQMLAGPGGANSPNDSDILTLTPLRVLGGYNPGVFTSDDDKAQLGSLGGDYRIQLAHPWAMQTDWSNHAYRKKNSDIIKDLISAGDIKRGFKFKDIQIDSSDDQGVVTRYKIVESEAKFIHQKVLPYTTIDNQPAYSFVDELGVFHLHSFKKMYEQNAKLIVLPPMSDAISMGFHIENSPVQQLGIYDGGWWIGKKFLEQLGNFKKTLYAENPHPDVALSFVAKLPYQPPIPGYTLMKKEFIDSVASTDAAVFPFRTFEDIVRLNTNNNAVMNEYFQLSVTVDFAADLATVGTPVQIKLAGADPTADHWMNGKWLVVAAEHSQHSDKGMRYYSKYLLSRPALDNLPMDIDPSTLYNAAL